MENKSTYGVFLLTLERNTNWVFFWTRFVAQPGERYLLCKMAVEIAISQRKTKSNSGIKTFEIFIFASFCCWLKF